MAGRLAYNLLYAGGGSDRERTINHKVMPSPVVTILRLPAAVQDLLCRAPNRCCYRQNLGAILRSHNPPVD
jgi:hypothetical protein